MLLRSLLQVHLLECSQRTALSCCSFLGFAGCWRSLPPPRLHPTFRVLSELSSAGPSILPPSFTWRCCSGDSYKSDFCTQTSEAFSWKTLVQDSMAPFDWESSSSFLMFHKIKARLPIGGVLDLQSKLEVSQVKAWRRQGSRCNYLVETRPQKALYAILFWGPF